MTRVAVVALGGNAIARDTETGTYAEQTANARSMAKAVRLLREAGWTTVIVHGNGPQVGNLLLQQEAGHNQVPGQPLVSLDSMTQGQIGSLIGLALYNELGPSAPPIATIITHVIVRADDPAFARPTKPIGPFYSHLEAERLRNEQGWTMIEDSGRGFRRLAPSPVPQEIIELGSIRTLVESGAIVIAAGGGGVPVVRNESGLVGVDAVIDKDRSAARLASSLGAEALVLVTGVDHAMVDFGTPRQRALTEVSVDEAQRHLDDGQFPPGSMGPKVEAAIQFIREGGAVAVITTARLAAQSLDDAATDGTSAGTRIVGLATTYPGRGTMTTVVRLLKDTYLDSVLQMSCTRQMGQVDGVEWATVAMATPANLEALRQKGFEDETPADAGAGDLFLAVRASDPQAAEQAIKAAEKRMSEVQVDSGNGAGVASAPRTLEQAIEVQPDSSVAVISTPGDYAALEAHKALTAGLDVLLFSDNVSVAEEIELKERATELGLLVMGPGAGTAMLGRTCLGFANVTMPGRVAVVAAAGTGAQEAMTLLDRWGVGVSHVIGLGGRDLSEQVNGRMAKLALQILLADSATEAILLVSKPPSRRVAQETLAAAIGKPVVAALIGLTEAIEVPAGVRLARTLESGVAAVLATLDVKPPALATGLRTQVEQAIRELPAERTAVRGLFSGGTLCYESLVVLSERLGPVYSNTPLIPAWGLPAPADSHVALDLGEEEYTQGRPHPMIDAEARLELLREQGADPHVAVLLLDVVLGYGAHPDPASQIAPACAAIIERGGPRIVVYVLGTDHDPQNLAAQRRAFIDAGCIVPTTSVRASLAAAAIATRQPDLVEDVLR